VLNGPGRASRGMVSVVKMVDAEETVWAPHLGLRGVVDAVAVGKLNEPVPASAVGSQSAKCPVSTGMIPVELKTGYWRNPVEHGAQLALYTLMLGERYKQRVPFGLLHYTRHPGGGTRDKKDEETIAIRPGPMDIAHLMHRRNLIATALNANRGNGGGGDGAVAAAAAAAAGGGGTGSSRGNETGVSFAGGTLPPIEQCRSECERCFVKETCMTVNAAFEGGAGSMPDESLAGLSHEVTGHLTPQLTSELSKWLKLIDAEAAVTQARRATPWMPVADVRRRKGFAMDGFTLRLQPRDDATAGDGGGEGGGGGGGNVGDRHVYVLELSPATPSSGDGHYATQHRDGADDSLVSALRSGDRLVLSRQRGEIVVSRVVLKTVAECASPTGGAGAGAGGGSGGGVALEIDAERLVRMHGPGAATATELWRIDRDDGGATMSGRLRSSVVTSFASQDPRAEALRRRVFALQPPTFDQAAAAASMDSLSPGAAAAMAGLNDEQRAAVKHILAARDYALVRGLPGAGKSATLAAAVRALVDLGKSVLITSHTHSAVDNILKRLPSVGIDDFVRVGGEGGKAAPAVALYMPAGERHAASTTHELSLLANSARVVGATCYAVANNPVVARRESRGKGTGADGFFDVVLVDEAGQMTLPASLAPLLRGAVFVLVGDPHQLPPLVQSKAAAEGGLGESILERLAAAHPASVAELNTQYRMADDLAKISNVISYAGRLRAATREVAERSLALPLPPPPGMPEWLRAATDPGPSRRVVMLDTSDLGAAAFEREGAAKPTNACERGIVLNVLRGLVARGALPGECAVLSPYNAQVDAVARDLAATSTATDGDQVDLSGVEALTIDRAQGRDVETVIISLVRANAAREAGALLADRRRLNVALTRARSKLIIVGCGSTLRTSPVLAEVLGVVVVEGWMVPLAPAQM
jgi:DNA replication ATP-dependent helicase Dna2